MKKLLKYVVVAVVLAGLVTGVYYKVFIPKHTFTAIHPSKGSLKVGVQGIGNVDALNLYTVTAQTGGKIIQILADEGDRVKQGELLVVMDGVDLPQQREIAQAGLLKAKSEMKALQEELNNQQARKILFQVTSDRYQRLNTKGLVAQAEYDKAKTDLQEIKASIAATTARIESSRAGVQVALQTIEALQQKIARLKVYSPVDGYVIGREAEVAQYVQPSSPVLKIVDPSTLWVVTKIDERICAQVKPGQKATIILRSQPDKHYRGVVKRIDSMTDPVTLERKVNVSFDALPDPFYINEQARVTIDVKHYEDVVKVPLTIVVQRGGQSGLWVKRNGKAYFMPIKEIASNNKEMALLNIDASLSIIVPDKNNKSLADGMRIYK